MKIYSYKTTEYIKDIGTSDRLKFAKNIEKSEKFLASNNSKKNQQFF